jgi:S-DNA-T family DNA segregation ATPase FtsK/SpoIIIE
MRNVLASTACELAARALKGNGSVNHQCFRIKNLHADEIVAFIDIWDEVSQRYGLQSIRLLVTDSLGNRISSEFVADSDKTITYYRNHNPNGLIYVESSVQSDEQGLQNIFSLRDSNFLDGSFDEYVPLAGGVVSLIIQTAWDYCEPAEPMPNVLEELLLSVSNHIHPALETVPIRKFILFVQTAIQKWLACSGVKDWKSASRIVGESLIVLGLFPDHLWNQSEGRTRRRLELNLRHSELINGAVELDADQLSELAIQTKFKDEHGELISAAESEQFRRLCIEYGQSPTDEIRSRIPYFIFSQLFTKDTVGLKLGDKVREEIATHSPSRQAEFLKLDVQDGLNVNQHLDAVRFLDAQPNEGETSALKELISAATRRALERIATPAKRPFFNPFLALTELANSVSDEFSWQDIARVKLYPRNDEHLSSYTLGLFAFLFGPTLSRLSDDLNGLPGACQLEIDERLIEQSLPPPLDEELGDDEQRDNLITLAPLEVRVEFYGSDNLLVASRDHLEWDPGSEEVTYLAVYWLLVKELASYPEPLIGAIEIVGDETLQKWIDRVAAREISPMTGVHLTVSKEGVHHSLIRDAASARREFLGRISDRGLDTDVIDEYLDAWNTRIASIRNELVPDGARLPDLDDFLATDFVTSTHRSARLLTPLHPIRLRWTTAFLRQSLNLAAAVFQRTAKFSGGDSDLYIEWLKNRSPRETPPIASGADGELLFPKSELGWWEDYSKSDNSATNLSFDVDATNAVINRILSYLEAHPYKKDGLSILIVMPSHDAIPAEIIEKVTKRATMTMRMAITVIAPRFRWESISKAAERTPIAPQSTTVGIFPPIDLSFIDNLHEYSISELIDNRLFDIGIVTHLLENRVVCQPITEPPLERLGYYDVLSHRPLRLTTGSIGSMALVLLPTYKDPVLEAWSTLVVRNHRMRPVSPGQPENIDLVELRVNFQDSARVFKDLHNSCHWVITLERHISREQLESAEAGSPDILSVEHGIGENQKNTMVVSSRSGRELICAKLVRKLTRITRGHRNQSSVEMGKLAEQVYESTRHFSPRLALQALGVTKATEEILGLTIARRLVETRMTNPPYEGLMAYLSLDDHARWFGGNANIRADICRLTFEYREHELLVKVLVVEGKLRQEFDDHGIDQVRKTLSFLRRVLEYAAESLDSTVDAKMWREELANAIEESSSHAKAVYAKGMQLDLSSASCIDVKVRVLADLREGNFRVDICEGLYAICLWDSYSSDIETCKEDNLTVMRTYGNHVIDLLSESTLDVLLATSDESEDSNRTENKHRKVLDSRDIAATENQPLEVSAVTSSHENSQAEDPILVESVRKRMTVSELKAVYERILSCYRRQKIDVSAAEEAAAFVEGPASIVFRVKPSLHVDPKKLHDKGAALKLALELEEDQNVSFGIDRGFVIIDVPKNDLQRYYVDAAETWSRWDPPADSLAVPVGENHVGEIVTINFSSANSPHLLVAGTTGSGKSEALNAILFGLTNFYSPSDLKFLLIDPKGTELTPFEGTQYLLGKIGFDEVDAIHLLEMAVSEMEERYSAFRAAGVRNLVEFNKLQSGDERKPWWLIVLDEYADLTSDPQAKKDVEQHLKRLAAKARAAGIHIIIATQKPSAEVISTTLRSNLPAQLALKVRSGTESRVIMDSSGAEYLNGKGDAYLHQNGVLVRVQCSMVHTPPALPGR